MTTTPKARVTDKDREAAAPYLQEDFDPREVMAGEADSHWLVQAFAAHRTAAIEEAVKICDERARWHEEAFRKEVILKNAELQTHFAARHREADELAETLRALNETPA